MCNRLCCYNTLLFFGGGLHRSDEPAVATLRSTVVTQMGQGNERVN